MAGLRWQSSPEKVWPAGGQAYARAIRAGLHAIAQKWAAILENEMRQQAPWTDRTGNARQSLYARVDPPTAIEIFDVIELVLAHGVEYGVYLELKNQGRFAIVNPTIDRAAPRIWDDVRRMLS